MTLPEQPYRPKIAIDFDGVIHAYVSPWTKTSEISDSPTPGAREAVQGYIDAGYEVVVFSCRAKMRVGHQAIWKWLFQHGFPPMCITAEKPSACIYIDDRGFHFTGSFPPVEFIKNFVPWNKSADISGKFPA